MRRWLIPALLVLSLAVNVFTIGFGFARYWPGHTLAALGADAIDSYPRSMRKELWREVRMNRDEIHAELARLNAARAAMREAISATPYDAARARAAADDVQRITAEIQEKLQAHILAAAGRAHGEDVAAQ
ncbi:periplasmic heavy metal sensor [Mangrovibrevibacter kandeliae]|uniref:periplasmic heavy metal sensor n=1 Tax=Mangrovibrevibacter kandeliae TaxID=2968473 RepID=UPI002118B406|nr:periplasmic heavy metal sensor [Aurantimonas sp. CSK15Z-1]MCQ8784199.1 periplasmic heavy metal sensor [Aurantimonas sp. CSK15Z-1]